MTRPPGERPRVIEVPASDGANPHAPRTEIASAPRPALHPTVVLAVLCVAQFLAALDVFIVNVALPNIGAGFGESSLSNLSWILNAYAIVIAALMIPAGRLGDLFGRKRVFLFGMGIFTAASIGAALSGTLWVLVGFRIVQAAGAAAITPTSLGLLMVAAPAEKRAVHVKIWTASAALAAATGPVVGGLLVEASWRWIFLLNVPIGVVAIAAAIRFVPDVAREAGARLPDLLGGMLLVLSIGSLALGLVKAPDWGWSATATVVSFIIAAIALLAFLRRSAHHSDPVLDLNLLRSRVLSSASVSALLYFASFGILLLSSVLWLQGHWHYSPVRTGLAIAPGPCCVPLFAVLSELAAKRIAVGVIAAFGCVLSASGAVLLLASMGGTPSYVADFLPGWLLVCIGFALAMPTVTSSGTAELLPDQSATGSALVNASVQIGLVIGISILVAILGTASIAAELHVFRIAWWSAAGIVVGAGYIALGVTPRPKRLKNEGDGDAHPHVSSH
jgi:EmrB/QacA subfamily drug resistance transporter